MSDILPCDRPPLSESEAVALLAEIKRDPAQALEKLYTIKNKRGRLQTLTLNKTQQFLHEIWELLRSRNLPVRIDLLKYRQGGLSTYVDGRIFLATAFRKGITSWKISHDESSVKHLFGMSRLAYDHLPEELQPQTTYSNRTELIFATQRSKTGTEGLNSQIQILTAKTAQGTRSHMIHHVHNSEVAFWPEGDLIFTSLLPAVPDHPDTTVINETTANGENFFFKRFAPLLNDSRINYHPKAIKSGETWNQIFEYVNRMVPGQWMPVFIPWTLSEECSLEIPPGFVPTRKEAGLLDEYGLTLEQIFWRRNKILHVFKGNETRFQQEFPLTAEEAFLRSGKSRFNGDMLQAMTVAIRKSGCYPDRFTLIDRASQNDQFRFDQFENSEGEFRLWSRPDDEEQFVAGADTSEGAEDFHSAHVLRQDRGRDVLVATLHCKGSLKLFARKLVWLCKFFNRAFVGIEANSGGLYCAMFVSENYNNCYQREAPDELEPMITAKEGWRTSSLTRPLMLAELDEGLAEGSLVVPCLETIDELKTFVRNSEGRYAAASGCFDDRVFSLGIARQMSKIRPYSEKKPAEYYKGLSSVLRPKSKITGY